MPPVHVNVVPYKFLHSVHVTLSKSLIYFLFLYNFDNSKTFLNLDNNITTYLLQNQLLPIVPREFLSQSNCIFAQNAAYTVEKPVHRPTQRRQEKAVLIVDGIYLQVPVGHVLDFSDKHY